MYHTENSPKGGKKRCSHCGETKPISAFSPRKTKSGNIVPRSWCKACSSVLSSKISLEKYWLKKGGEENREKVRTPVINGKKECTHCHEVKPTRAFPKKKNPNGKLAIQSTCKHCCSLLSSARGSLKWRTDPEYKVHRQEKDSEYHIEMNRKAKIFSPGIDPRMVVSLTCEFCGGTFGVLRSRYNASIKSKGHPQQFCSRSCANRGRAKVKYHLAPSYAKQIQETKDRLAKVPRVAK